MNKILLVSPHLDDAILSAGCVLADRPNAVVVTVFAGNPQDAEFCSTPYDLSCGFGDAAGAMAQRREENSLATALLNAAAINLEFVDEQYGEPAKTEDITNELQKMVDRGNYDYILAPLGLGHPDHIQTCEAVRNIKTDLPIYLWEDLPLRVVEPELVPARLAELGLSFNDKFGIPAGDMTRKIRSLSCYTSQIGTGILDPFLLYVPERFYKI